MYKLLRTEREIENQQLQRELEKKQQQIETLTDRLQHPDKTDEVP